MVQHNDPQPFFGLTKGRFSTTNCLWMWYVLAKAKSFKEKWVWASPAPCNSANNTASLHNTKVHYTAVHCTRGGGRLPAVLMRHPPSYLSKPWGGGVLGGVGWGV